MEGKYCGEYHAILISLTFSDQLGWSTTVISLASSYREDWGTTIASMASGEDRLKHHSDVTGWLSVNTFLGIAFKAPTKCIIWELVFTYGLMFSKLDLVYSAFLGIK